MQNHLSLQYQPSMELEIGLYIYFYRLSQILSICYAILFFLLFLLQFYTLGLFERCPEVGGGGGDTFSWGYLLLQFKYFDTPPLTTHLKLNITLEPPCDNPPCPQTFGII